jgi:hypothetical protein
MRCQARRGTPTFLLATGSSSGASTRAETASVTVDVPTLTCVSGDVGQNLFIFQDLVPSEGDFAFGLVVASCGQGSVASYGITAGVCSMSGCDSGCGGASVSPGDSVTFSETSRRRLLLVSVRDTTNGAGVGCQAPGIIPIQGSLFTGICGQDIPQTPLNYASSGKLSPLSALGCYAGVRPQFSPVGFSGAIVNGESLSSRSPTRYDMVSGTTLQIKTGDLKDSGESFTGRFVTY